MTVIQNTPVPELFRHLADLGCLDCREMACTEDGFHAATVSVASLLARRNILELPGDSENSLECSLFFDDWYLYAVPDGTNFVHSLFKMREQEYDAENGRRADGDTPGITVCFIAFDTSLLLQCLTDPSPANKQALSRELDRVVASRGQVHKEALKAYFVRTEAQGPYLVAGLYTAFIASLARDGSLPVPVRYAADLQKHGSHGRIFRILEENNRDAGRTVCDHERLYFADPARPSLHERLAVLATHTGNPSPFSFAAEIQFHAKFLTRWARIPIPFLGRSVYASAIRADMSIGDAELVGPTPYYRPNSRLVKNQFARHRHILQQWAQTPEHSGTRL